jgi:stalled ribosome rescue protein Dom34
MKIEKQLGIWMDHADAHVMELAAEMKTIHVRSAFTQDAKEQSLGKSEHLMHNKEHHQHLDYYKRLGAIIKNYDAVLLFGPTDAKRELHNYLNEDAHFSAIKITVESADKMTENQEFAHVRNYFAKALK